MEIYLYQPIIIIYILNGIAIDDLEQVGRIGGSGRNYPTLYVLPIKINFLNGFID